jgi:hypothetical protein
MHSRGGSDAVGVSMAHVRRTQGGPAQREASARRGRPKAATVTVTIRMPASMVEALKTEAQRQGVRGYQTLMKLWIEDRLAGDRVIPARRLRIVLRRLEDAERELRRLMAQASDSST